MPHALRAALPALIGGVLSAGLVLSVETGSLVRLLLLALAPLPLFASGLSAGMLTCLAAGLAGAVIVTLAMGTEPGLCYLAAAAVPAAILVWQALRAQRTPEGGTVWYSGGNLLLWFAGLGVVGVLGTVGYLALFQNGLVALIREWLDVPPSAAESWARIAPGMIVSAWMTVLVVDAVGAEWMLTQVGKATRPPIDIGRLSLPLWLGPVLMVAGLAGAILREGTIGIVSLNCAIVLIVPFAFLGLATIHALARGHRWGPVLLGAIYLVLLASPALFGWQALMIWGLMLAGLGSADQLVDLRDMRGLRTWKRK